MDKLGFEPKTFRMQSEHSTPELHALIKYLTKIIFNLFLASKCGLFINERYMNIPAEISLPAIRTLREEIPYQIDYWIVHAKLRLDKNDSNTIYYVNGEEEIFEQHSTLSIDYHPVQSNANEWIHKRKILFVSTDKLDRISSDIEQKLKQ